MSEPKTLREAIAALNAELRAKRAEAESTKSLLDKWKTCSGPGGPRDGCFDDGHSRRFCWRHDWIESALNRPRLPILLLEVVVIRIEQALNLPDAPMGSALGADSDARPT